VDEPVWIEGDALKVALELGLRPEAGDEVRLTTRDDTPQFRLTPSYRGMTCVVLRVERAGDPIYYVSPSGWVYIDHITAILKRGARG
jgi:hypothetical protein